MNKPGIKINYDALGAFFYNPHPPGPGGSFTTLGGIRYPFGTLGVIVCGKHYVVLPQQIGHIQADDPNFDLIIMNLERMVGEFSRNDMGLRRVYLERLETDGEDYLESLDKAGANTICTTIQRTVIEALQLENAQRAARHIPPRDFDHNEQRLVELMMGLIERLDQQAAYDLKQELEGIRKAAMEVPDFASKLDGLPISELRKTASAMGAMLRNNMKKHEIIAVISEMRAAKLADDAKMAATIPEPVEVPPETGSDDDPEADLDETVTVDAETAEDAAGAV